MGINPLSNDIQQEQWEKTQARFRTNRALAGVIKVGTANSTWLSTIKCGNLTNEKELSEDLARPSTPRWTDCPAQ